MDTPFSILDRKEKIANITAFFADSIDIKGKLR